MRSISNLVALLIAVVIAVGVGIAVAVIVPSLMASNAPKRGVLTISGSEALYDQTTGALWIELRGYYSGSEPINITSVTVLTDIGGSSGSSSGGSTGLCYEYQCVPGPNGMCPNYGCHYENYDECRLLCYGPINAIGCTLLRIFPCSSPRNVVSVNVTPMVQLGLVKPNSYIKVPLRGALQSDTQPSRLVIIVSYCFADGTCTSTTEVVPVKTG